MGNNVDLVGMLGLPELIKCPHCGARIESHFNDHDIECATSYEKGHWKLRAMWCYLCEKDFTYEFKLEVIGTQQQPKLNRLSRDEFVALAMDNGIGGESAEMCYDLFVQQPDSPNVPVYLKNIIEKIDAAIDTGSINKCTIGLITAREIIRQETRL